ncbi:hypothetical protein BJF96_g2247 [Verticillium dahliae]|uniref:Uncharacterized protein n=1 Tax=Verticillium dahliae TaxID=27337 RepID=A0AA44WN04_VERDA|nr:hypothetical protein BJF96_g2247 [Verticillium dahliae]
MHQSYSRRHKSSRGLDLVNDSLRSSWGSGKTPV